MPGWGERNHRARLTNEQAQAIWVRLRAGVPVATLARYYGVCLTVIYNIRNGNTYRHATNPTRSRNR